MNDEKLHLYPFTPSASQYVNNLSITLKDLLRSRIFERARLRGEERVIQALKGEIKRPNPTEKEDRLIELLSYPFARILVSCVKDPYIIRRFALAEAKASYETMKEEDDVFLSGLCQEFGIEVRENFKLFFSDYLRLTRNLREKRWKLVNRDMDGGWVKLDRRELSRLLQEVIHERILEKLPLKMPKETREYLSSYTDRIESESTPRRDKMPVMSMPIDTKCFPPCISNLIKNVRAGANIPHSARFALTSFLLNIGMSEEQVMQTFRVSPDFDEDMTRYQIRHISSRGYTAPSCSTMETYGNCQDSDELCDKVSHPLFYYRVKSGKKRE